MKLYQFLLLFTFFSVLINAYSINGDIPLPENLRINIDGKKKALCINIPGLTDEYVTNCRLRYDRRKVYCDVKGKGLYVMIPITKAATTDKKATEVTVKEWYVLKKEEGQTDEWNGVNEIMETGWFEKVEAGDTYYGSYSILIYGDKRDFILDYDRIVINKY